jgi:molybdate transport system ATP-binding protein
MVPREMNIDANFTATRGSLNLDVRLQVGNNETLALLGPNGAGKSTVLRILAGLHDIESGQISLDSTLVDGPEAVFVPPEQRNVGMMFQDHLLFPHLRLIDNVAFGLASKGIKKKVARAVAREWLGRINMGDYHDARPSEISGGQAQRVALARALAIKPQLLLLDEPLAAADATARLELRRTIQAQLKSFSGSCVLVAHDIDDALALADRIAVLENGRIVQTGTIDELGARPASRYVADLIGLNCFRGMCSGNALRMANGAEVILATTHDGPAIATVHPRAVALFREKPAGSPRNVFQAPVVAVERALDCIRVRLGGDLPIVAEVTESAVGELGLDQGGDVWAAVKATEFRVAPS